MQQLCQNGLQKVVCKDFLRLRMVGLIKVDGHALLSTQRIMYQIKVEQSKQNGFQQSDLTATKLFAGKINITEKKPAFNKAV